MSPLPAVREEAPVRHSLSGVKFRVCGCCGHFGNSCTEEEKGLRQMQIPAGRM